MIRKTATVKWNESEPARTVSFAVARTLSAGGRPLAVTYPSGRTVEYIRGTCPCLVDQVWTSYGGARNAVARGNVSTLGDKTLMYDHEGRLQKVLSRATTLGSYGYDGFGARVRKTAGGVVTLYVTDFDGNLIGEANSSGIFSVEYLHRGRVRLARTTPGANTAIYTYANNEAGAPECSSTPTARRSGKASQSP